MARRHRPAPAGPRRSAARRTRRPHRPSSTRAAPAKNRSWSTIGGISSSRTTRSGLPVSRTSSSASSSAWREHVRRGQQSLHPIAGSRTPPAQRTPQLPPPRHRDVDSPERPPRPTAAPDTGSTETMRAPAAADATADHVGEERQRSRSQPFGEALEADTSPSPRTEPSVDRPGRHDARNDASSISESPGRSAPASGRPGRCCRSSPTPARSTRPREVAHDDEVVDDVGEDQDRAGEDRRRTASAAAPAGSAADRRRAEVDGRLLVLLADREQPRPHDDHRVGQLEGDQAGDLRRGAQRAAV